MKQKQDFFFCVALISVFCLVLGFAKEPSLNKGPTIAWPTNMSLPTDCLFVSQRALCTTLENQVAVLVPGLRHQSRFVAVQLFQNAREYESVSFQCKDAVHPYCIVLANAITNSSQRLSGVFKIDLRTATARTVGSGGYRFWPSYDGRIVVTRSLPAPIVLQSFVESEGQFVDNVIIARNETFTWQLPVKLDRSNVIHAAIFAFNPTYNSARVIIAGRQDQVTLAPDSSRLLSGFLSPSPPSAQFAWAGVPDFARTRNMSSRPQIDRFQAQTSEDGAIEIVSRRENLGPEEMIIQTRVPQTDMNGDVYVVTGSPNGTTVSIMCQTSSGNLTLKNLMPPSLEARLSIASSVLTKGVTIRQEAPGNKVSFSFIAPSGTYYGPNRLCTGTASSQFVEFSPQTAESSVPIRRPSREIQRTTLSDNKNIPAAALVMTKSRVAYPNSILVDIYGAAGGSPRAPHWAVKPFDAARDQHWVAQAILPGDGDLGRRFAGAAASPNRMFTVSALNQVVEQLVATYPSLAGNVTLRAASAGASTALLATLTRPDLYTGAIIVSGAYDWRSITADPQISGFHGAADQSALDQAIANAPEFCNGSKFFVFHASDDSRVGSTQALAMFERLERKHCLLNRVVTTTGGHDMSPALMNDPEAGTFLHILRDRASQPFLKDLDLAKRVYASTP